MDPMNGPDGLADLEPIANGQRIAPSPFSQVEEHGDVVQKLYNSSYTRPDSKNELRQRDRNAVEYSKGELNQGDTLVFIDYPNGVKVMDYSGFELKKVHRVHSENLLRTGSPVFKKMLEPLLQARYRRRRGFAGADSRALPAGIEYIVDLTPPDEGDDATILITDLSCSRGVLAWFTACKRLHVSETMAGGRDEIQVPKEPVNSEPSSPAKASFDLGEPSVYQNLVADDDYVSPLTKTEFARSLNGSDTDAALQQALKESKEEAERKAIEDTRKDKEQEQDNDRKSLVLLDYCPIRHRAGVERLLQLIEGKSARLDSAPKIWTIVMLAKFFKCTSVVKDYVTTWLFAEPNCKFIEILPEAALRIGYALETESITRRAFAVLVAEEAMRVGTPFYFKSILSNEEKVQYEKKLTRFGRPRETDKLDDDMINTIQHAGRAFSTRIEGIVKDLLSPELPWIQNFPEYEKLDCFLNFIKSFPGKLPKDLIAAQSSIAHLKVHLVNYVRGRLFYSLLQPLNIGQARQGTDHRDAERWTSATQKLFGAIYDGFSDCERSLTRFLWVIFRDQEWNLDCFSGLTIPQRGPFDHKSQSVSYEFLNPHNIKKVYVPDLEIARDDFNRAVIKAIEVHYYNGGEFPEESFVRRPGPESSQEYPSSGGDSNNPLDIFGTKKLFSALKGIENLPTLPADESITSYSPYFCLWRFLKQVSDHVHDIARSLLSRGECEFAELVDTLTCLTDNEYKFLPLWAGGMDDGTGGVFDETIPFADRGGPVGPGPSYHTGSTLNSWAGSDISPDDSFSVVDTVTEGVNSSVQVEDGNLSHVDRRTVVSEEEFPDVEMGSDGTLTPATLSDNDDFFNVEDDDLDLYNA